MINIFQKPTDCTSQAVDRTAISTSIRQNIVGCDICSKGHNLCLERVEELLEQPWNAANSRLIDLAIWVREATPEQLTRAVLFRTADRNRVKSKAPPRDSAIDRDELLTLYGDF